jgi:glycosyltransferase involved in cell wall biosynthesis
MDKDVTVLIASYNHGSFLYYQLESLLGQTTPPKRIIVLDDGSTDDTQSILERYKGKNSIQFIYQEKNIGLHAALCRLMREVDTEFFAFASADDLLTREWCETMSSLLEAYPEAKIAISNTFIVDGEILLETDLIDGSNGKSGGVYEPREFAKAVFRKGKMPPSNTIMYRSDIIQDLILPVFSLSRLGPVVDVILILEIAMRYPTAYSAKSTGIVIKSPCSYGSSKIDLQQQRVISERIEQAAQYGKFLESNQLATFVNRLVRYAWTRQAIMRSQAENRANRTGLGYCWRAIALLAKTFATFITFGRMRYIRFVYHGQRLRVRELNYVIDERLLRRFSIN